MHGPFFPGDEFEFLKRRFRIEADGSITVRAAAHFYLDIYSLLGGPRLRNTPGPVGDLFMVDDSPVLGPTNGTLFRTVVGKPSFFISPPSARTCRWSSNSWRPRRQRQQRGHFACSSTWPPL